MKTADQTTKASIATQFSVIPEGRDGTWGQLKNHALGCAFCENLIEVLEELGIRFEANVPMAPIKSLKTM